jgi:hypothetical protein
MARNLTNETLLGLVSPRIGGIELVFLYNNKYFENSLQLMFYGPDPYKANELKFKSREN